MLWITVAALIVVVEAKPAWPEWKDGQAHKTWKGWNGWPKPSLYTPAQPTATWGWPHGKPTGYPHPTGYPTSSSSNVTSAHSTTISGSGVPSNNACASVSELAASYTSASPSATPTVPAELAYECINSVPFNQSAAVAFLDSIRPYLDWQTTIQYLKDPPAEYAEKVQPAYDFYANFERIYDDATSGAYASEYAFGLDVYFCFQQAHDGHFVVYPDSSNGIFSYGRTTPLVSVSLDGKSIPEVFVYSDILDTTVGNASYTPSPLALIDGQDSTEWLLNYSQYGSLQDRDALWNNMFYLLQQVSLGSGGTGTGTFSGGGRGRWIYPGPSTTLTFANGSSVTNDNFARVLVPFDNITSGEDIYQTYFIPPADEIAPAEVLATSTSSTTTTTDAAPTSTSTTTTTTTTIPAPGFPTPLIREMNNQNSGYFLEGEGYDDIAVLSIASFVSAEEDELPFQSVNTYLIDQAVANNKTKLIIDVSANGGGTILQGYDIFKQLFPSILPYGATRFRAHEAFDYIGQEVSYYSGLVPRSLDLNDTAIELVSSAWNYRTDADVNYEPFTSWPDKYGPETFGPGPDNFTEIIRWNMSDILTPINSGGIDISGYLNRSNITTQPFKAENIVVVTDGYCASTCTIFSELMRQQAGVKYVNLGGRPNKDITQAVGGVKGTNDFPYSYILSGVIIPFTYEYIHSREFYNETELGTYDDLVLYRTTASVVNSRDGFREGDETNTPLQFQYEPADCRIYYTPAMAVDQTAAWKTVADAAWNGVDNCVAGSLGTVGSNRRRGLPGGRAVRRDLKVEEHLSAMKETWTGKDGIVPGGDGYMHL